MLESVVLREQVERYVENCACLVLALKDDADTEMFGRILRRCGRITIEGCIESALRRNSEKSVAGIYAHNEVNIIDFILL